jgi:hypothetical protein
MNDRLIADAPRRNATNRTAGMAIIAAAVACLVLPVPAAAALYKWIDANGRVVYSDQPPPANIKSEQLNATPPAANPHAVREMANQEAELKKREAERAKQDEQTAKSRAEADKKATACARAAGQVRELAAGQQAVYRINEKGERALLDDAARVKERQQLERWLKANCPN